MHHILFKTNWLKWSQLEWIWKLNYKHMSRPTKKWLSFVIIRRQWVKSKLRAWRWNKGKSKWWRSIFMSLRKWKANSQQRKPKLKEKKKMLKSKEVRITWRNIQRQRMLSFYLPKNWKIRSTVKRVIVLFMSREFQEKRWQQTDCPRYK